MVAARIDNKRIVIRDIDELVEAANRAKAEHTALVIVNDRDGDFVFQPPDNVEKIGALTKPQYDRAMSTFGRWKRLIDGEALKQQIRESRGQAPRDWEQ